MFDIDDFITRCVGARHEDDAIAAVKEVLDRALEDPASIEAALPSTGAEFRPLYSSPDLTVMKFVWGPAMSIPPHNHLMWAVNGIYVGAEDNAFFRRGADGLVPTGGRRMGTRESCVLGREVIHAVTNPDRSSCTGSLHVYGGDFLGKPRSIWDADGVDEHPADGETMRRLFEDARRHDDEWG
jgi:predicted metal-dependent enzyme (double-stranded beta helix superfamily)